MLTCTNVFATEWEQIIQKSDRKVLVDLDSYTVGNGYPIMTTKTIFTKPQSNTRESKKSYISKVTTSQYNCEQHTFKNLHTLYLDQKNRTVDKTSSLDYNAIRKDSIDQEIESLVCQVHKMVGGL